MREAEFYKTLGDSKVQCLLCPHMCLLSVGQRGLCRVRENIGGKLYTLNYGRVSSLGIDPIEKKPLYHFYPGRQIFSVGTFGCNFRCQFCQNWEISQGEPATEEFSPERLVAMALRARDGSDSVGIAYTYSEPVVWYEFVYDCAKLAHEKGLKNVLVTNGSIQEEPLMRLLPYIDAMNIDVKAFTSDYYRRVCRGELEPVLRTVERAYGNCHIELTTLLVPGMNDSDEEIEALVDWVASLGKEVPLHFSRYFPRYRMELPPTPLKTLVRAWELARRKLDYVYIGNAWELGEKYDNTCCPECGALLVRRSGYYVVLSGLEGRKCKECGAEIAVVVDAEG
ncbi:MAG: AmmeMemoRadiSam system radical SAM enzyme [Thermacetogeniaceae bacterium]